MTMPKVSVITAFYNRAPVLRRTIESILQQGYADLELLVVDDCSSDDTSERLAELAAEWQDPRLRIIRNEPNKGFVRTMRDAIEASTGEYIAVQGSGDASLPDRIARQAALLDAQRDVVAVGCWYRNIDDESGAVETVRPDAAAAKGGVTTFSHGEMMMRRSAYDAAGGYRTEFKVAQLTDLGFRLHRLGGFATVPEVLYDRHVQSDGVTYNANKVLEQAQFLRLARHLQKLPNEDAVQAALASVREGGVSAVIPVADGGVQLILAERCIRLCAYDRGTDAATITSHVTSPVRRRILRALARVSRSRLSAPVRWALRLALKTTPAMRALWMRRTGS
ncbi:glycosyltransferase family 2 protein [Microbacterium dauci]|uniref:Glycosyltransferase family A protein n=1 Tax=Microbacterium dauci TaxID=3048008 RepID=A0ABT6ZAB0_9MICO|nr:glycosyltransferase family A protein [Microbacterium sp. LX3-4]MDJ1112936.1 glycosyltransferase family A protein [Microbacterium sp. LX3-4]